MRLSTNQISASDGQEVKIIYVSPYSGIEQTEEQTFSSVGALTDDSASRVTLGGLLSDSSGKRKHLIEIADQISEGFKGVINYFYQYQGAKDR